LSCSTTSSVQAICRLVRRLAKGRANTQNPSPSPSEKPAGRNADLHAIWNPSHDISWAVSRKLHYSLNRAQESLRVAGAAFPQLDAGMTRLSPVLRDRSLIHAGSARSGFRVQSGCWRVSGPGFPAETMAGAFLRRRKRVKPVRPSPSPSRAANRTGAKGIHDLSEKGGKRSRDARSGSGRIAVFMISLGNRNQSRGGAEFCFGTMNLVCDPRHKTIPLRHV
jgi:hypothetical protein